MCGRVVQKSSCRPSQPTASSQLTIIRNLLIRPRMSAVGSFRAQFVLTLRRRPLGHHSCQQLTNLLLGIAPRPSMFHARARHRRSRHGCRTQMVVSWLFLVPSVLVGVCGCFVVVSGSLGCCWRVWLFRGCFWF